MASQRESLGRNLLAGARIMLLRRVAVHELDATPTQIVLLVLASLALVLAYDVVRVGWNGHFTTCGLPGALFPLVPILFAAWAASRIGQANDRLLAIAVGVLAATLWITVASWALSWGAGLVPRSKITLWMQWIVWFASSWWVCLAAAVHGARLIDGSSARRVAAAVATVAIIAVPLGTTYVDHELWVANPDEELEARRSEWDIPAREDVLYLQPKLLERELAAVQPAPRAGPALYFIGVGAYGGQDVFMREMQAVSRLFAERFRTEGRAVTLVNNRKTAHDMPWATVTALRASLIRVAASMQRDRDVLFLYLSSHGSREHRLSFSMSPLRFDDLDPATLRALLDESGIRHRVIVVSACYSGGFVDALKNDDTLVITASAADRNSFGCANELEFMYFGKAYFDDALRHTYSFTEAFGIARELVSGRERNDGFEPSNPQIAIGRNIERTLQALPHGNDPVRAIATRASSVH
jgi:hypothetical protein